MDSPIIVSLVSLLSFLGVLGVVLYFSRFSMKFLCANRIAPDGTPHNAASYLGLYCLPLSQKGTPGLNELTKYQRGGLVVE